VPILSPASFLERLHCRLFHLQMRIRYGRRLWAYMLALVRAVRLHEHASEVDRYTLFRQPVKRKWQKEHHAVPSPQDVALAFRRACEAVDAEERGKV